jgi:hypothetical protein
MSFRELAPLARVVVVAGLAVLTGEVVMRHVWSAPRTLDPAFGWVVTEGAMTRWAIEGQRHRPLGAAGASGDARVDAAG